jgi:WD40 repeat protein
MHHPATEEITLRDVLGEAARRGDRETVDLAVRSVRYWAMRLRLADPGLVEQDLALATDPESAALAQVLRHSRHLLRSPDEPWQSAAATLLLLLEGVPELAAVVAETEGGLDQPWLRTVRPLPRTVEAVPVQTLAIGGSLTALAVADDGKLIVAGHEDGSVSMWGVPRGDLLATSPGHASYVRQIVVSPDASSVVSCGVHDVQIWHPAAGSRVTVPLGDSPLTALAVHPDGSCFVVANGPNVRFFDYAGRPVPLRRPFVGALLDRLLGSMARFRAGGPPILPPLALALVFLVLLTAAVPVGIPQDLAVPIGIALYILLSLAAFLRTSVNLRSPRNLSDLLGGFMFQSLCFAPDGKLLATVERSGRVQVWCASTGRLRRSFHHKVHRSLSSIAFDPAGTRLAVVDNRSDLTIWDPTTGRVLLTERNGTAAVRTSVSWSPDGSWLAYGADHSVRVRRLAEAGDSLTATTSSSIRLSSGTLSTALIRSGRFLLTAGDLGASIKLWDHRSLHEQTGEGPDNQWVRGVAYHLDGAWLALASEAGGTFLLTRQGTEIARFPEESAVVHGVATAPDGSWVATGDWDGTVRRWDGEGRLLSEFRDRSRGPYRIFSLTVSAAGHVTAGCDDGRIRVWDADGCLEALFDAAVRNEAQGSDLPHPSVSAAVHAFGEAMLASTRGDGTVQIHDLGATGPPEILRSRRADGTALAPEDGSFTCLATTPDGRTLAAGHWSGEVSFWEIGSATLAPPMAVHRSVVRDLAYSPCGSMLLTIGATNEMKIWDLASRTCILSVRLEGFLVCCAWSPAGNQIAIGSSAGVFQLSLRFPETLVHPTRESS